MRVDLEDKEIYQDFIKTILGFRSYYTCTDMKDKKKSQYLWVKVSSLSSVSEERFRLSQGMSKGVHFHLLRPIFMLVYFDVSVVLREPRAHSALVFCILK